MMKKLLAVAIAAGLAAPAIADTTLYGQLHASVDVLDADGAQSRTEVSSNSSRIGVKGSADLNDGLKLIYVAEFGMDTGGADSPGTFSGRNQIVGVKGGFGTVLVGRHDTPMKIVGRKADLFWSTQIGQNRNLTNNRFTTATGRTVGPDARLNNMIGYKSPKVGGFEAFGAYVTDLNGSNSNDLFSINGIYNAGPLTLGAAYERSNIENRTVETETDAFRLMGAYKFGAAKVVAFYQNQDVEDETTATGATTTFADEDVYGLGMSYKVSPVGTVKGQYYKLDNDITNGAEADMFALGYDHKLGKATEVYAQYVTVENDGATAAGNLGVGGSGHGESITSGVVGGESDALSVGIRHKF